jgi:hypothetical protein
MRFTVIDVHGRVSFVAACSALEGLVAACTAQPRTLEQLLSSAEQFLGGELEDHVLSGLAVFDEHNSPANFRWIHAALDYCLPQDAPVFRVVDPRTEEMSLSPVRAGVVVFNLVSKRIVQIQNTYAEIRRKGRVRVLHDNRPTGQVYRYELPADWSLVPSR